MKCEFLNFLNFPSGFRIVINFSYQFYKKILQPFLNNYITMCSIRVDSNLIAKLEKIILLFCNVTINFHIKDI